MGRIQLRSRKVVMTRALVGVLAVFAVASILFVAQGGFGAGHLPLDPVIFILGLPWVLILVLTPASEALWVSDYVMLVLLPLGFNLLTILAVRLFLGRRS